MENLKVNLAKRAVYLESTRKYWWKIKHKSSSSSEDATDTRIWYTDSKKHGYVDDDRMKIIAIRKLEERQGKEPIDWTPAEHRITTPDKLERLNKLVDRAEKEERRQRAKKVKEPMKPPSIKHISKTKYEIDWGKNVYRQEMAYDRQMNEIIVWNRRNHGDDKWDRECDKNILELLEKVIAEFKESDSDKRKPEARKDAERKEPTTNSHSEKSAPRNNLDPARDTKTPSFERIAKNKLKSGKFIWHRNKDGSWFLVQSLDSKKGKPVPEKDWDTLDQIFSELPNSIPDKNPNTSSKRKRPTFAERNKHGGLIIHGLADSRYYSRFDIRKSKNYPRGFTFRMGRGKLYILETLDAASLAAIEKEISWALRS